ncbi:MAG TPA: hypothetical protein VGL98_19070 [Gammaproteobacteria bacterium]
MRVYKSCAVALVLGVAILAVDAQQTPTLAGRWEGVLAPDASVGSRELGARREGPRLATVVVINGADGKYIGKWTSVSQGNATTDIGKIEVDGANVRISVSNWGGRYEGKLSDDGLKLEGRWIQNGLRTPFVLTKVAAAQ